MLTNIIYRQQRQRRENLNRVVHNNNELNNLSENIQINNPYIRRRNRNLLFNINGMQQRQQRQQRQRNQQIQPEQDYNELENDIIDENNNEPILQIPLETSNTLNQESAYEQELHELYSFENNESINIINNINNNTNYYSDFRIDDYNIRYFHNIEITVDDYINIVSSIMNNIYENELNRALDNSLITTNYKNEDDIIIKIKQNTIKDIYKNLKNDIKNDICPIILTSFEDTDIVYKFINCNHGICEESFEKYCSMFKKCPLCNSLLY